MQDQTLDCIDRIVNLQDFPITQAGSRAWRLAVERIREQLSAQGCSVLRGFIHSSALQRLEAESVAAAPKAYFNIETVNAYNIALDSELEDGHPAKLIFERGNAFVARDQIPTDSLMYQLYTSKVFQQFVAACFEVDVVHELADPLAGLCINVLQAGREHPWHFDTNEYTVSLLTKSPSAGGQFEFCPNIRTPDQENLNNVKAVLENRADNRIQRLSLRCGDLQLFRGRHSLHRVNHVTGQDERHSAIFAYTEKPGVIGSVERTRQLFGRVLPEHYAAQAGAVRSDALLD